MANRDEKALPVESELRLAGDPEILSAIFESPLLKPEGDGREKAVDLESRYFDTRDRDLLARGLAFRIRTNGAGCVQTLKSGDDARGALTRRGQWEMAIDGDRPKLDALPKAARTRLPAAAFESGLQLAFVTRVHRRVREVGIGDGRVEAALDLGVIETGGGGLPIAEIELELLDGPADSLYELALELQALGPLHLETRSKSTRAFDHIADMPPNARRATALDLRPDDSVDDAMSVIFQNGFEQWLGNQAAAIDGRDPEGVHQMRVALRRLRSAFSMFRGMIPPDQFVWLQASAKETIGALGPARDWDVFRRELLTPVLEARPGDPALIALRDRVRARGRAGCRQARRHLEGAAYTRFALRFGQWLERRAWREGAGDGKAAERRSQPMADFAGELLGKRRRRALRKGRKFADLPTERRHELRIALKKLRYAVEFFQPLYDKKAVRPFLRSVKALQEDLGHLNDVAVAETLIDDLLANPGKRDIRAAAGLVIGWHAHGVALIEPDLRRDWKAFKGTPTFWS